MAQPDLIHWRDRMKTINKITGAVDLACRIIAGCLLIFICAAIVGQVIVRKLGGALIWVDELTRYAFVWLVLFGTVDLARAGGHISITSFLDMLPRRAGKAMEILIYLVVSGFSGIMTYAYLSAVQNYKGMTFSVLKFISMSHYYRVVAALMGMITLASLLHIADIFVSFNESEKGGAG